MRKQGRFILLDGVRGIAALVVMMFHFRRSLCPYGWACVDIFFALSGFVLSHAYAEKLRSGMTMLGFLKARFIRLYPLYLVGLVFGILSAWGTPHVTGRALAAAVMVPLPQHILFPINAPAWSLLDEMVINVAFAATILSGFGIRWILTAGVLGFALCLFYGCDMSGGWGVDNWWIGLARVCLWFPSGVMAYRFAKFLPEIWAPLSKTAAWLGGISYALYITHFPIHELLTHTFGPSRGLMLILGPLLCIAIAHVLTYYVDAPFQRYISRFGFLKKPIAIPALAPGSLVPVRSE